MKTFAFAAALLVGTAAIAQTTPSMPDTATPPGSTTNDGMQPAPSTTTTTSTPTTMGQSDAAMPTASNGTMTTQSSPGATTGTPAMTGNMTSAPIAQAAYPPCSRTVTDQCRQSSARERDTRGSRRRG